MSLHMLSHLTHAGVLERTGGRGTAFLRVTPRFLSHAEGTAGRLRLQSGDDDEHASLEVALRTWDNYRRDAYLGALVLRDLLERKGQLSAVRQDYRPLDAFAAA